MNPVLLTVSTTHRPATDLGYLLVKHPDRVQSFGVYGGTAHVFYPEATEERCTAALMVEIDPAALRATRERKPDGFTLRQYVNDRPYAASSLLSAALAKVCRSALRGDSRDRPELAATPIPLTLRIPALRCRGGATLAEELFTPLGWAVAATPDPARRHAPGVGRVAIRRPDTRRHPAPVRCPQPGVRAAAGPRTTRSTTGWRRTRWRSCSGPARAGWRRTRRSR